MADNAGLRALLDELAKTRGLDLRGYKPASLQRRLRKRMDHLRLTTYEEYLDYLRANPDEINHLLSVVLINVTQFFRDPQAWDALRQKALPMLLQRLQPGDSFRAWCAGCATGEEVYSLAILLAEHFGSRLNGYDVKIYATDHDEEALNQARRGEYSVDRLNRVRPEWRERYFTGTGPVVRVHRELRRLAIFGHSNLAADAPISHVRLLVCRNVLIYFDVGLQTRVLQKFRYALEDGGVLFLGRSESQLRGFDGFVPIDATWRIFQCGKISVQHREGEMTSSENNKVEHFNAIQRYLLETLRSGVMVINGDYVVTAVNEAALKIWGLGSARLLGTNIRDAGIFERCPQLAGVIEQSFHRATSDPLRTECKILIDGDERSVQVTVRPMLSPGGQRLGTLLYTEDITAEEKLRSTIEELETTGEELQSTNEELETTNEELQSANEELETTNEELHSLNEELETTNDELEQRTRDLEEVSSRYAEMLAHMPLPLMVVNDAAEIQLFNGAAEELFNLAAKGVVGLKLDQLPLPASVRKVLVERHQAVLGTQDPVQVRGINLNIEGMGGLMDVRFLPLFAAWRRGVLIIFEPVQARGTAGGRDGPAARRNPAAAAKKPGPAKRPASRKNRS